MLDISKLANGIAFRDRNGEVRLASRLPLQIPRFSPDFTVFELQRPMRLNEISIEIYGDWSYWALLGEWNAIPTPASYLMKRLPLGFAIHYMTLEDYETYRNAQKRPNFNQAGEIDITPTIAALAPQAAVDSILTQALKDIEESGLPYVTVSI